MTQVPDGLVIACLRDDNGQAETIVVGMTRDALGILSGRLPLTIDLGQPAIVLAFGETLDQLNKQLRTRFPEMPDLTGGEHDTAVEVEIRMPARARPRPRGRRPD